MEQIRRSRRAGISERIGPDGSVVVPLDEAGVHATVARLIEEEGIEAVAVCYLFSFRNPAHERRTAEIIAREFPRLAVSVSSEVDPVFREYERTCVTAFDAYVRPIVNGYLDGLDAALRHRGIRAPLLVMQSRGGAASARRTVARPVTTLLSGPAAGALGGRSAAVSWRVDSSPRRCGRSASATGRSTVTGAWRRRWSS